MTKDEVLSALKSARADWQKIEPTVTAVKGAISWLENKLASFDADQAETGANPKSLTDPPDGEGHKGVQPLTVPSEAAGDPGFPRDEGTDEQVIYTLRKIGRAIRKPDLEAEFNKAKGGGTTNLQAALKRMLDEGKLVAAKFKNSWTLVFYGLPEWTEIDGQGKKTFKEEFRPSGKDLPNGFNTINFYLEEEKQKG
jgi:hypothetical protein